MKDLSTGQFRVKVQPGILGGMLLRLLLQRLFLPTLVLLILTIGLAGFMTHRSLDTQQMEMALVLADSIDRFLADAGNVLRAAAEVADQSDRARLTSYLKASREGFGYFDLMYRLDKRGIIVQLEPEDPRYIGLDQSRQPFFVAAKAKYGFHISRPFNSKRTGKPTVNMIWPLAGGGMMVAELNLGTFQDAITAARHAHGSSTIVIVDQAGTLLAHPRADLIAQQARLTNLPMLHGETTHEATWHYRWNDEWMLGSTTLIRSTGWVVLVQVPLGVLYGPLLKAAVPLLLVCLLVWVFVAYTFQQRFREHVVAPLADLSTTATAISAGNLDRTARVEREDEIGIVARAFNIMTAQLREVIGNLEERVNQLIQTREELKSYQGQLEELVEVRTVALTERTRQLEEQAVELTSAKKQADEANLAKSEFLARMSHEIRTPLNAVTGLTNVVLKSEMTPEQRDYLGKVQIASRNLLEVINDILDFSKVEAGRLELSNSPFDLDNVLEQLADMFSSRVAVKELELIIAIAPDVPRQLTGDASRLTQVLINLVENAVKFTESGEIVIGVESAGGIEKDSGRVSLQFRVTDTGLGIAADLLPTLFDPFTQVDSSLTRRNEGTGLGLAICKRLVELMGGTIAAESVSGKGSSFSFTIEVAVQKGEKPLLRLPGDLHGLKALVVDDSATARQVMSDLLESFTFRVSTVNSGEKALTELRLAASGEPYQLVLMDWKMRELDGIETAAAIRKLDGLASMPIIIMVTAYGHELLRKRIDTSVIDSMLMKPVKPSGLLNLIMELFGKTMPAKPEIDSQKTEQKRLVGRRVLVVEDSDLNRDVAVALLEEAGLEVETAENGKVAVETVISSEGGFDAIMMDIQMPVMDGYQATEKIRSWEKGRSASFAPVPIIALTAHALKGEKDKCLHAGMDDYLAKPIDEKKLQSVLIKWIASNRESTSPVS